MGLLDGLVRRTGMEKQNFLFVATEIDDDESR